MRLRDQPARLLPTNYARRLETRVLFSDMDAFRHLNNGATGRYLEEGRADLNLHVFGKDHVVDPPEGASLLFVSIAIEYLRQAYYPGRVEILTGVSRVGGSSYVVAQAAFQNDACIALAEAVVVKAMHGRPSPLTQGERDALAGQAFAGEA